jgi:hypothetical protein
MSLTHLLTRSFLFLLISFALISVFSCAPASQWATTAVWDEFLFSELPGQEDFPDAGAVILLDEGNAEIVGSNQIGFTVFERHRVVKIFNGGGYRHANISVAYNQDSEVEMIEARTISADGKITVLKEEDIFDITIYPHFIFYSDQKAKLFTFPAVDDDCILEYKYRLVVKNRTLVHSWYFQDNDPVKISRFSLKTPTEWDINYQMYHIDIEGERVNIPNVNKSIHTWEARDLPALPAEVAMPPTRELSARIAISPIGFNKWSDVARWYHTLSASQMETDNDIKEIVTNLTADTNNDQEKLQRIFEWARDRVRYIAVSIGIGGFKPHKAGDVLLNRYGDCKDMTTLICAAAKAAGIPVHQVLISTRPNGYVDTSLVSPYQFNHVIAYAPVTGDSGLWLDATKKGCPFGQLPWYNQDRLALIVDDDGNGNFVRTPNKSVPDNKTYIQWEVDLDTLLNATIVGKSCYWGAPASETREVLFDLSNKECKQWIEGYLAGKCPGIRLESFSIAGLDTVRDPLTIHYKFDTRLFASQTEKIALLNPGNISLTELPDFFRARDRATPVQFRYGLKNELNLEIKIPKEWNIQIPTRKDSISSPFGNAIWKWETTGNVFRAIHKYTFGGQPVSPELYPQYQEFLDDIHKNDLVQTILFKNLNNN